MSRPLRLEYAGAFWHVTSRGNERREIFRNDDDRSEFLRTLERTVTLFRWRLHAYVLMGNHYHLLVETPEPTLSRGMRQLNGLYTQGFNRRHRRVGHLFQGRFKAILVEKDAHLLELARYVVLNPVRAGVVRADRVIGRTGSGLCSVVWEQAMSRPLRLEYAGAFWHVTSRGNERREIFRNDDDRSEFLRVLGRTVALFRWRLHAYVLMGNHYHLLVETPEPMLSRGMRQLNGLYTQGFNRRNRRVGHLFQGRFKAILVEKDAHLLELARYVVLNPVRAGIARSASAWPWSSYRATAGIDEAPPWLETATTLEAFAGGRSRAIPKYREFVAEGRGSGYEPWKMVEGQIYLGGDAFHREAETRLERMTVSDQIPSTQRKPRRARQQDVRVLVRRALGVTIDDMRARPRKLIAERQLTADFLRRECLMPMKDIGEVLAVRPWQASALARAGEESDDPRRLLLRSTRA